MDNFLEWATPWGLPVAMTGLLFWLLKRWLNKRERAQIERDKHQQKLFLMMMQSSRANCIGITAVARAVQRIPDAHCNGDMEAALEKMAKANEDEKQFLLDMGVQHIFPEYLK